MNECQPKRNLFIDIAKGTATFFVLWGHCIQVLWPEGDGFFDDGVFKFIYSFHMPLFCIISGYLFYLSAKKYTGNELLYVKSKNILKPIIGGNLLRWFFSITIIEMLKHKTIKPMLGGDWIDCFDGLWYLWSILAVTIAMSIVKIKAKNTIEEILLIVFGFFIVLLFPHDQKNIFMYPYFVVGYYFAGLKDNLPKLQKLKYITFFVFPVLLFFYNKKHYIYTSGIFGSKYSLKEYVMIDAFRWLIGFVGIGFILSVISILTKIQFLNAFNNKIALLGKYSLQIYILNTIFLESYLPIGVDLIRKIELIDNIFIIFQNNTLLYNFVLTFITAILFSFILYYISKFFEKIKISKYIFGR